MIHIRFVLFSRKTILIEFFVQKEMKRAILKQVKARNFIMNVSPH